MKNQLPRLDPAVVNSCFLAVLVVQVLSGCSGGQSGAGGESPDSQASQLVVADDANSTDGPVINDAPSTTAPQAQDSSVSSAQCVDTAPLGDGWGWNGVGSCALPVAAAPTPATTPAPSSNPDSEGVTAPPPPEAPATSVPVTEVPAVSYQVTVNSAWQYNCALDADPSTQWVWVLRPDNNIYDLSGIKTGTWRWWADSNEIGLAPSNNVAPRTRIEGENIVLWDSRGGDYGLCRAENGLPPVAPYATAYDDVMFHCNIHGEQDYYVFQPDGRLTSQYGFAKGSSGGFYERVQSRLLMFNGIGWTVNEQGVMTGANHVSGGMATRLLWEFCTQHTGTRFVEWNLGNF